MDYSKLINDYLEGELKLAEEQSLFSEMAYNDALREEFTGQVKLNNLFMSDLHSDTPPVEVTDHIFNQLGFSIPTSAGKGYFTFLFNRIGKTASIVLLILLALFSTAGGYLIYDNYFADKAVIASDVNNTQDNDLNLLSSNLNSDNNSNNVPLSYEMQLKNFFDERYNVINNSRSFTNSSLNKDLADNTKSGNFRNTQDDFQSHSNFHKSNINNQIGVIDFSAHQNSNMSYNVNHNHTNSGLLILQPNNPHLKKLFGAKNYAVHTKGAINSYYPDINQVPLNEINSFEIAFWLNYDELNSYGLQIGRQLFTQDFQTNEGIRYFQAPELFWIGASYKRYFMKDALFGFILPYSSIMGGATTIGPLFRLESGIELELSGNIQIMIGAEGNTLFYNVDGNIYNSNNIGIVYGLKYSF